MPAPDPIPRWGRWFLAIVGLMLVGVVAWAAWPKWETTTIGVVAVSGAQLEISTYSCGGEVRADVDEQADEVTITVSVFDEPNQVDCDGNREMVTLDAPLGDRELVDGSNGEVLFCEPPGATVQECVR